MKPLTINGKTGEGDKIVSKGFLRPNQRILSPLSRIEGCLLISPMEDLAPIRFLLRPIPSGMLTNMQQKTSQVGPGCFGPSMEDSMAVTMFLVSASPGKNDKYRSEN
jgi:hypothetical protein